MTDEIVFPAFGNFVDNFSGNSGVFASKFFGENVDFPDVTNQAYFINDNWRVRPNLTLNLGLRYELYGVAQNTAAFPAFCGFDASKHSTVSRRPRPTRRRWSTPTTASGRPCAPWPAPSSAASARGCSGCRPAGTTPTRDQGAAGGGYGNLMGTLDDGLFAFYTDVRNQRLANDVTVIVFSEFGRRISENGSAGTDHGAAGLMMVLGGMVRGGLMARPPHSPRAIRRSRTTPATCGSKPTSGPSTPGCSTSGWA